MNFNLQPNDLKNEKIQLIPLLKTHFDKLFEVASDSKIWEQHPNPNRYKLENFTTYFKGAIDSKGAFLILDSNTNEVLGSSRFYDYIETDNSVLIGYTFIGEKFWGKEYNKVLKKLMLDYAFQFVDKVYFHIGAYNIRSQKAIEKIGAVKIDEFEVEYYGEEIKLNFVYLINKN
ncbi:GNAT family N-acetyltransferase [Flavobacterium sp.]|uniref:GNAT family N-acetyltransferase n=1 Tax=Flavobacterium sp. TaxID=239 RepID=UPI0025E9B898|nr:GNAT family N-acetyltransferase [Flavobacterium sp.]